MPYRLATAQYRHRMYIVDSVLCTNGVDSRFEPTVSSATNWRFNQLSYTHHMALKGFEPLAYCLEGSCSIQLSYQRICNVERVMGIRTHATSLEGWSSTIELHPHFRQRYEL